MWETFINTSKSRKLREREREHTKFVYPVRSNTDLVSGREQLYVPLYDVYFTKRYQKGYKNKSSNLILPKVPNLFP